MSSWAEAPLGDLISYIGKGLAPTYTDSSTESSVMVLGQKCVRNQAIDYKQARFHDEEQKSFKPEKEVLRGDILINATGVGSAGRVAQVLGNPPRKCITDGHVITLRTNSIDPFYLGYFVKSKQSAIEKMAEGSTGQTEMNRERLKSEVIVTYPVETKAQETIAGVGLSIDRKIAVNNQINGYFAAMAEAKFKDLVAHDSNERKLSELVDILSGGTPKTKISQYWDGGEIPFFGPGDVKASSYVMTTEKHITQEGLDNCNSSLYPVDTVLLTARGTVGKVALAGVPMAMNQSCFGFQGKDIPQPCVYYLIKSAVRSLRAKANGATFAAINMRDLNSEVVRAPSIEVMRQFGDWSGALFASMRKGEAESNRLAALRDVLLPKLMSGEIDVSKVGLMQPNSHLSAD